MTGLELRNIIRGSGKTIDEAADLLGISRQTLSGYFSKNKLKSEFIQNVKDKFITLHISDPDCECDKKVIVRGDSMAPYLCSGDEVGVKSVDNIIYGNCHFVKTKDFELFRYVLRLDENKTILRSFNPVQYQDVVISNNSIKEILKLVYVCRKF